MWNYFIYQSLSAQGAFVDHHDFCVPLNCFLHVFFLVIMVLVFLFIYCCGFVLFNCHDCGIPFDFCGLMFFMVVMILVFFLINMVLCSFNHCGFLFFSIIMVLHSFHHHAFGVPPNHHGFDVPHGCYGLVFLLVFVV